MIYVKGTGVRVYDFTLICIGVEHVFINIANDIIDYPLSLLSSLMIILLLLSFVLCWDEMDFEWHAVLLEAGLPLEMMQSSLFLLHKRYILTWESYLLNTVSILRLYSIFNSNCHSFFLSLINE